MEMGKGNKTVEESCDLNSSIRMENGAIPSFLPVRGLVTQDLATNPYLARPIPNGKINDLSIDPLTPGVKDD